MYTYVFSRSVFPDFYHCVIRISCSDKTRSEWKSYFRPTVPKKKTQQQLFGLCSDLGRSLNNTELNISSQKGRIIFSLDHSRVPSLYFSTNTSISITTFTLAADEQQREEELQSIFPTAHNAFNSEVQVSGM